MQGLKWESPENVGTKRYFSPKKNNWNVKNQFLQFLEMAADRITIIHVSNICAPLYATLMVDAQLEKFI